jgi:hypothetical protein
MAEEDTKESAQRDEEIKQYASEDPVIKGNK